MHSTTNDPKSDMIREYGELDGFMGVAVREDEEGEKQLVVMVRDEQCGAYQTLFQLSYYDGLPLVFEIVGEFKAFNE
jgi:hypothetical protein